MDVIRVQGARVNNLKDISVEIPKRRLKAGGGSTNRELGAFSDSDLTATGTSNGERPRPMPNSQ